MAEETGRNNSSKRIRTHINTENLCAVGSSSYELHSSTKRFAPTPSSLTAGKYTIHNGTLTNHSRDAQGASYVRDLSSIEPCHISFQGNIIS